MKNIKDSEAYKDEPFDVVYSKKDFPEDANFWFAARGKLFERCSRGLPRKVNRVLFSLGDPHAGWLPIKIKIDGNELFDDDFTGIYGDPAKKLVCWLEDIIKNAQNNSGISSFCMDNEGYDIMFVYECITCASLKDITCGIDIENRGVFMFYDDADTMMAAVCDTKQFVRGLYESIKSWKTMMLNDDGCLEEWLEFVQGGAYSRDSNKAVKESEKARFSKAVTSPIVEKYLKE